MTAEVALEREFLAVRAKILEIAAALDRIQRSDDYDDGHPKLRLIHDGIQTLLRTDDDRAEQIQLIFSRSYDDSWQKAFDVSTRK